MDRRIEISVLATAAAGAVGSVVAGAEWLRSMINPDPTPGFLMFSVAVAVMLLTGVACGLVLALVARLIGTATGAATGFWHDAGLFLQDFALWLTIWTILWGAPFAVAMVLAGIFARYLVTPVAVTIAIVIGIGLLILLRKYFSREVWEVLSRFWPARRIGSFWMVVGVLLLTLPGRLLLERCYKFDVTGASGVHDRGALIPIEVSLAGRLVNHEGLRLEISPARSPSAKPVQRYKFDVAEPGTYVTWINPSSLRPGVYRIRVFFDASTLSGFGARLAEKPSIFVPPERRFLMRIE